MKDSITRRFRGVLTHEQARGLTAAELRRLLRLGFVLPMAGGADGDDRERKAGEPDDGDDGDEGRSVPLSQLRSERRRRAAAEKDRDDIEARLKELEDRDKSEVDRLKEENAALKGEVETLKGSIATDRKERMIADAARDAGFHNPRAALGLLDRDVADSIDSAEAARTAVKELAKRDGWLVKDKKADDRKGVEKILADGREVDASKADGDQPKPEPGIGTLRQAYAESGAASQD